MSKKLLVTYGYHLKEKFAQEVGLEFAKLDMPNVVTARIQGVRGFDRYVQMRKDMRAKYALDLHDDSPALNYYAGHPREFELVTKSERYWLIGNMGYNHAMKLHGSFAEKWNTRRRRYRVLRQSLRLLLHARLR